MNETESLYPQPKQDDSPILDPIKAYFSSVRDVLTQPGLFFDSKKNITKMSGPIVFGLITAWIGAALEFLWRSLSASSLNRFFEEFVRMQPDSSIESLGRYQAWVQWATGLGAVLTTPFTTVIGIFLWSTIIFLAAKLFITEPVPGIDSTLPTGPARAVTFESIVILYSFSLASSLLKVIPFVGGFAAWIYFLVLLTIGIKAFFKVETGRAMVVALSPTIFGFILSFVILLFIGALIAVGALALFNH